MAFTPPSSGVAMRDWVAEWKQEGRIFVWRYPKQNKHAGEWHFTGDPVGCRSLRNLIDRMAGGGACHRTLKIASATAAISAVPNFGAPKTGRFTTMRIAFEPDAGDLSMDEDGDKLILTFGNKRLRALRAAFAEVEVGIGDFDIATSDDRKEKGWWFWWMP